MSSESKKILVQTYCLHQDCPIQRIKFIDAVVLKYTFESGFSATVNSFLEDRQTTKWSFYALAAD